MSWLDDMLAGLDGGPGYMEEQHTFPGPTTSGTTAGGGAWDLMGNPPSYPPSAIDTMTAIQAAIGGGGGGTQELPKGFATMEEYLKWRADFAREHGGMSPEQYYKGDINRAAEERLGSIAWAGKHGSPMSWGNAPGDSRVPLDVFKALSSARRSPDFGPQGPEAWADAADMLRGAILAAQGGQYHPTPAATPGAPGSSGADYQSLLTLLQQMYGQKQNPTRQLFSLLFGGPSSGGGNPLISLLGG